jgi:ferric-dicitrate binding protein FerR (iron transport regulator)
MEEKSENVMDQIWDRTLELFIKIHDCPDNPEHVDSLVHWLNENPDHLKAFNELGQIWISTGIALAREIGQPLIDLERDQSPLMMH